MKIEASVHIAQPSEEVFAYIADFENNPKWQSGMKEAHFTSEGPLRVGSTYTQVASFLGRRVDSNFEIIAYEPGRMVKGTTITSSFPITFTRIVEPAEDGCHVSAIIEGDSSGFYRLAEPLMQWMVQRSVNGDYANLKRILEEDSSEWS